MIGIENSVKLITIRKPIQFQHPISFLFPSFKGRNLIFNLYLLNNSFRSTWEIELDNNFIDFPQKRKKKEKRAERANFYSLFTEINPSFFQYNPYNRSIATRKRYNRAEAIRLCSNFTAHEFCRMRWIPRFPPVCAQHNTRSTLDADILKAHGTDEETKMASRHLSVHLSSSSLPFLFHLAAGKQPWIRLSPTRHDTTQRPKL